MLKIISNWMNALMGMSDHWLSHNFKVTGRFRIVLEASKMIDVAYLHFQLELNVLQFWIVPTDKNLKEWNITFWGESRKSCVYGNKLFRNFSLLCCGELIPKICPSILGTPSIPGSFPSVDLNSVRTRHFICSHINRNSFQQ